MQKLVRAVVIRRKILNHPNEDWEFAYQNEVMRLSIDGNGWRALIWANLPDPASSADPAEERRLFLDKCRRQACPYMLNVWCENQGEVLSILSRTRTLKMIILRRGKWEEHFGLRPPGYCKASELKAWRKNFRQ